MFLHANEIKTLIELLDAELHDSCSIATFAEEHGVPTNYRFYLTGPMGVGKSTTINQFRNLRALDEWMEPRPNKLAEPPSTLPPDELDLLDRWLARQFRLKNNILKDAREGIFVMDRGPMDPLAFTEENKWSKKARYLLSQICRKKATFRVMDGKVILLCGDAEELALRMLLTARKRYTEDQLLLNAKRLAQAYRGDGVVAVETKGRTPREVAQRVAEIIHLERYKPTYNLHKRLEDISKDGFNVKD